MEGEKKGWRSLKIDKKVCFELFFSSFFFTQQHKRKRKQKSEEWGKGRSTDEDKKNKLMI